MKNNSNPLAFAQDFPLVFNGSVSTYENLDMFLRASGMKEYGNTFIHRSINCAIELSGNECEWQNKITIYVDSDLDIKEAFDVLRDLKSLIKEFEEFVEESADASN